MPPSPLLGVASYRRAVKHLLTSVVREICTLRSVGAGARATALGHPVGDQQCSSLPRSHSLVVMKIIDGRGGKGCNRGRKNQKLNTSELGPVPLGAVVSYSRRSAARGRASSSQASCFEPQGSGKPLALGLESGRGGL